MPRAIEAADWKEARLFGADRNMEAGGEQKNKRKRLTLARVGLAPPPENENASGVRKVYLGDVIASNNLAIARCPADLGDLEVDFVTMSAAPFSPAP